MSTTKKLVIMGILTALSVVLTRLLSFYITGAVRVGFGEIPIIIAGIWLGPLYGGVVGGLSDIVGANLLSGLGFYPPIVVGPILIGSIAGIMSMALKVKEKCKLWKIAVLVAVTLIVASVFYTTFALQMLMGGDYFVLMLSRIPAIAISAVGSIIAIYPIQSRLAGHIMQPLRAT